MLCTIGAIVHVNLDTAEILLPFLFAESIVVFVSYPILYIDPHGKQNLFTVVMRKQTGTCCGQNCGVVVWQEREMVSNSIWKKHCYSEG